MWGKTYSLKSALVRDAVSFGYAMADMINVNNGNLVLVARLFQTSAPTSVKYHVHAIVTLCVDFSVDPYSSFHKKHSVNLQN